MLAPVLDPLDRLAVHLRRERNDRLFGIEDELGAEAAANIRRDDAQLVLVAAEQAAENALARMRRLRGAPHGEQVAHRIESRHHTAAFHRLRDAAMLPVAFAKDMRGLREGRVAIAVSHVEFGRDIVRRAAMGERRVGAHGVAAVADDRQRIVIDHDERGRVFRNVAAVRDDRGDRLAHMHHFRIGQHGTMQFLPIGGARQGDAQKPVGEMRRDVLHRQDGVNARDLERRALVDAEDLRMRMRAAHESDVPHAGERNVVDEARLAAQQRTIFETLDARADDPPARRDPRVAAHDAPPAPARIFKAASSVAATMPS